MNRESVVESKKSDIWNLDLNYSGENNYTSFFSSTGNIHSYPAKAVPDMVHSLLLNLKEHYNVSTVLDPFVGSGTVALESKVLGLDFFGSDLNPLAVMLSKVKVLLIENTGYIEQQINILLEDLSSLQLNKNTPFIIEKFENIEFWFKRENIRELSFIKDKINQFLKKRTKKYKGTFALILLIAFSSTIRTVSLTRNGEFKLYRISPSDLEKFKVDAVEVFKEKMKNLLELLEKANKQYKEQTISEIHLANAKDLFYLKDKRVDLVLTSPPYGDSKSTVAYGQYSKLSLQWMKDLMEVHLGIKVYSDNCDEHLLGGKKSDFTFDDERILSSQTMRNLIEEMNIITNKRKKKITETLDSLNLMIENNNRYSYIIEALNNEELKILITERVRLDIYRKIKNSAKHLSDKKIKQIAKYETSRFILDLLDNRHKVRYRRTQQLNNKLPYVKETIIRKMKSQPKRIVEVINFFKDLYKVVIETDSILLLGGLQAWIVGHRTVLGEINVNMAQILNDWFKDLNYKQITSLQRQYSFKRMPHHINSTATRNSEIKTMMQEHILVVQKQ
ncbi:DNA adenine methylase [Paenibacillus sp. CH40]|uniref:DNA adenine methylase n=1 Tax=Paenibacillus sp. CH40 TaxID=2962045 RepID=UPI0020B79C63|nr:DNA adenine methylase [Paenibacillus sp. CH40]MCP3792968.1 DNA adenine methylase [Paenibacillus sp. CH40]